MSWYILKKSMKAEEVTAPKKEKKVTPQQIERLREQLAIEAIW